MQCRVARSIAACAILSLSNCVTTTPVDSYCQLYNKVVLAVGDGKITAPDAVKRRILANELTYRDQCGGVKK
jgi:hypothetical protein